ncbi:MAG: hypothetical protein GX760_05505 [Erysipelothrix sp.]|nr:hypothetical protein [Erysipelothrix sp.]
MAIKELNYKMEVYQIETDEGKEWVAEYPSLKGVLGSGLRQMDAINDLIVSANIHIKVMEDLGLKIPVEDNVKENREFSGKIAYRTSKRIHQAIYEYADEQNESMSNIISEAVVKYISTAGKLGDNE